MDNMNEPQGGEPRDESRPTEQFWPISHGPAGNPGPGYQSPRYQAPGYQNPGYQDPQGGPGSGPPRRRNPLLWTAGLVAAGALAIGGIAAGAALAGHSSPAASSTAAGPSTQAAALNSALDSADSPGTLALTSSGGAAASTATSARAHLCASAVKAARAARQAGHPAVARADLRKAGVRCLGWRRRLARVALLRGIDGQFTFRAKNGDVRTLAFQRGTVQSVSSSDIVVQAADGTTWTWDLVSNSVVRESGKKTSTSALSAGEPVWVGGPVVSGTKDARLVVIRPPSAPSSSSPAPAPPAASSSGSGS